MAYISAEDVNHIRVALKKEFPQYKFSVTRDHWLGVKIAFMKGPRFAEFEYFDRYTHETKTGNLDGHHQINASSMDTLTNFYGEENAKILNKVSEIAHTAPGKAGGKMYYDKSDAMIDYFDVAYYVSIHVGKWNKDYIVKEAA
jgi:hypothetical protein